MRELSQTDARRIAVRAQWLTAHRPESLADTAAQVSSVQVDATAYVAPNADLVFWSRLGDQTSRADLGEALDEGELVEVLGFLRPADDVALFTAEMAAWPGANPPDWRVASARWLDQNRDAHREALEMLRSEGPMAAREIEVDFAVSWRSSGWNNNKNIQMLMERLAERGEVAVSHREGKERIWDLAERIYPQVTPVPLAEASRRRQQNLLSALGLARAKSHATPVEPAGVREVGEQVHIEGVRGTWRMDATLLDQPFEPRTALLSPLDRLVFDRTRMAQIFEFDYALEMYKPVEVRRWGYFALPVLHGDQLVGKVDAEADHRHGHLHVHAIHRDEPWTSDLDDGVIAEIESLGRYLELEVLLP